MLIALGVAIIYFDYYLRALRWKILLRPVCDVKTSRLVAPTMIGFTALALLGRPASSYVHILIATQRKSHYVFAAGCVGGGAIV